MTDFELIKQFQAGEKGAFDELVKRHYPTTFAMFSRMLREEMSANDLCQETYIKVYKGLKKFRFKSEFTTWLYRISINVANNHFKKQKVREFLSLDRGEDPITEVSSESDFELSPYLWKAIAKLSRKQKMVLILHVFQGLPFKEVAGVMEMTENSAKVNYHYAIKNLKSIFGVE